MQIGGDRLGVSWFRAGIVPHDAGAVMGADPGELRDLLLNRFPERRAAGICACLQDDDRQAVPQAIEMPAPPTDIDHLARRWEGCRGGAASVLLVDDAGKERPRPAARPARWQRGRVFAPDGGCVTW
ncbi:MAG: hypothetical protein R2853_11430 [Thermomicrobiales bacterium]